MKLNIEGGRASVSIVLADNATVKDLKSEYAKVCKKSIYRLSFKKDTKGSVVRLENDNRTLNEYGVGNHDTLVFKDLGPQIGYRTVFVVEYAGPMFIMMFYALRPAFLFGANASVTPYNWVAKLGIICFIAHFIKRELETFFVHKFSRPTMPLNNLIKNCAYYWLFAAAIGYPLCSLKYVPPSNILLVYVGLLVFILSQIGNLICHIMLSTLRPAEGSTERPIPRGFLFELVSCPNYTFEVLAWVGFSVMTGIPISYLFTIVGALQMADWAQKKHQGYKSSNEKYKELGRKAIFPFIY